MNPTVATTAINEKHLHVKVFSCFRDILFNIRYLQLIERLFLQKLCINWWSEQFWSINRLALCWFVLDWLTYQSFTLDIAYFSVLTHFSPVSHFYTPWKRQKTFGFLTLSGGIECGIGLKWVNVLVLLYLLFCFMLFLCRNQIYKWLEILVNWYQSASQSLSG